MGIATGGMRGSAGKPHSHEAVHDANGFFETASFSVSQTREGVITSSVISGECLRLELTI